MNGFSRSRAFVAFASLLTLFLGVGLATAETQSAQALPPLQSLNLPGAQANQSHPIGSVDAYTDVSIDGGITWQPAIIAGPHPSYMSVPGTSAWLNCVSVTQDTMGSCTNTVTPQNPIHALFRYRFNVASDFQNASLTGAVNVDNSASIFLNGTNVSDRISGPIYGTQYWVNDIGTGASVSSGTQPINVQSKLIPGWNVMYVELEDGGGYSGINFNLTLSLNSNSPITLASPGSIVTFDAQGGTVSPADATVAPGATLSTITLPTPTRSGHTFNGWFTASTGGTQVTPSYASATTPTADLTLYAQWTASASAPGSPTGATAVAGSNQAAITWTAPVSNGGSAITNYTVTASNSGGSCTVQAPATSCVITGLNPGTNYTFTVTATNGIGISSPSSASNAVSPTSQVAMPQTVPTAQSQLTLSLGINSQVGAEEGDAMLVEGTGFAPNSNVEVYVYSTPTYAGRGVVGGNGSFSFSLPVPAGLARGTHTVVAAGFDTSGQQKFASAPIQIGRALNAGTLSNTGASQSQTLPMTLGGLAIALGVAGLVVTAATRRRTSR